MPGSASTNLSVWRVQRRPDGERRVPSDHILLFFPTRCSSMICWKKRSGILIGVSSTNAGRRHHVTETALTAFMPHPIVRVPALDLMLLMPW